MYILCMWVSSIYIQYVCGLVQCTYSMYVGSSMYVQYVSGLVQCKYSIYVG